MFEQSIYTSRDAACKQPYGAVPAGQTVSFSVYPAREVFLRGVTLYISEDGKEPTAYPMHWGGLRGDCDRYCTTFTPETPGLYWYHFAVEDRHGVRKYICRGAAGVGYESDTCIS